MYTSTVGRIFLNAYNNKFQTNYTAKAFFTDVFVPLFFGYDKYMMTAGNSPLENPKLSWDDMIKGKKPFESPERKKERIDKTLHKIETSPADSSIAIGYGVLDETSASASQITSMELPDNKDDIYLSWVGAGLGITVAGGLTVLFSDENILLDIFDGWNIYRNYLEKYPMLKGNQVNSWNGLWISHRYSETYDEKRPSVGLNPTNPLNEGLLNISTSPWLDVLWAIANRFKTVHTMGYIYKIDQTNSTIGFIPFRLAEIIKPYLFFEKIFGPADARQNNEKMKKIFGTNEGLQKACQKGSIGIRAMEPKDLRTYMPGAKRKEIKCKNEEDKITFNIYLIWIIAMLNNEKMWDISQEFAKTLLEYEAGAPKGSRARANNINQLLESSNSKLFINNLLPIIKDSDEDGKEKMSAIGKVIHEMPKDNYSYFNTLIKFHYALLDK